MTKAAALSMQSGYSTWPPKPAGQSPLPGIAAPAGTGKDLQAVCLHARLICCYELLLLLSAALRFRFWLQKHSRDMKMNTKFSAKK